MRVALILFSLMMVAPASAQTIRTAACQPLTEHVPDADVAYQPGVDAYGRDVAPADLNGGYGIEVPDRIDIPIRIDLAGRLGLNEEEFRGGLFEGEGVIGTLSVRGNDVYFNDQRIRPQQLVLLTEACKESLAELGIILPEPKPDPPAQTTSAPDPE